MDILGQSALLVGMTSFALGVSVIARNVRNKLYLSFAVLTTVISAWALAFFFSKILPEWPFYRLHLFFNIWLAPVALAFIRGHLHRAAHARGQIIAIQAGRDVIAPG